MNILYILSLIASLLSPHIEKYEIVRIEHTYVETIDGYGEYYSIYGLCELNGELNIECLGDDISPERYSQYSNYVKVGEVVNYVWYGVWENGDIYPE